ncbi:MAG: hypothetical protein NT030_06335 [Candidatus Saganbacteria bacterium]|nr:hypothetical protein [Candidatus Saganbacteria bacterium]
MNDLGVKIIELTNSSPIFKGIATIIVGSIALYSALYLKKKGEPDSLGLKIFTYLSIFVILFGLFILIFRPAWWKLPY